MRPRRGRVGGECAAVGLPALQRGEEKPWLNLSGIGSESGNLSFADLVVGRGEQAG